MTRIVSARGNARVCGAVSRNISEPEAITLFQEKLHESHGWHFQYTYIFMNQFVLFDVDFTPDGRVSRVSSPGHHW